MKKFINNPENVVDEMIEGFVSAQARYVRLLKSQRVVVRADAPVRNKVAVVTGGGSGHKPAFIGFVGRGMLDAVAVGDIFTSPTPFSVLEAAHATDGGKGVLLLLGNYSGDVMNFDMAAELAGDEGIEVAQSVATDDVGSGFREDKSKRRGVSAEWLIWKTAGAAAEKGYALAEVKRVADKVNAEARTMGVAASGCTVPAAGKPTFALAENEMELGVGHHGEPGLARVRIRPVDEIVDVLAEEIVGDLPFAAGDEVVTLINGLGATPLLELYIANRRLVRNLAGKGIRIHHQYVGEFFTALEMAGFSVTLCRVDQELKDLLDAPAETPYYVKL